MLCKTTMRAALAPVIGLFGVLVATTTSAAMDLTGDKAPTPLKYAAESLHKDYVTADVGDGAITYYKLKATSGELKLDAEVDILLPSDTYYMRYDFSGGRGVALTRELVVGDFDAEDGTSTDASAIAAGGRFGNRSVIFQVIASTNILRDTTMSLDLSRTDVTADANGRATDASGMLAVAGEGNITVRFSVYNDYLDARNGNGALFDTDAVTIIEVKRAVTTDIVSMFDTADVSTGVADGGPFRRFVGTSMGGPTSGVLGKTTVKVDTDLRDARENQTADGGGVTDAIVASTAVVATSDAGNFAVSLGEDGVLNKAAGRGKPWALASVAGCTNGHLTLGVANGELETYDEDPDGTGATGPLAKGDLTPAGIKAATRATGTAHAKTGDNYFCVLVAGNKEPIREIGDRETKDSYTLTITPAFSDAAKRAVSGNAKTGKVGAIDRNGTTVRLTYLTTNPEVDQRLVLVNRGSDTVAFWLGDFNLEDGTTNEMNNLSLDMNHMIPGKGRLVLRTADNIEFDGQTRGSATLNVAAPDRDIDVMTIQRSPATGEVDTTMYRSSGM